MHITRCHTIVGYNLEGLYSDDIPADAATSTSRIVRIDVLHRIIVNSIKV